MRKLVALGLGVTLAVAGASPALAQKAKLAPFAANPVADAAYVKAVGNPAFGGARTVAIPQFTVEFVDVSDGLSAKEEKRQDYVRVDYRLQGLDAASRQQLTDRLYAAWVQGLQARGLTVLGPRQLASTATWGKLAPKLKPTPAAVERDSGLNQIFSVEGAGFAMPAGARTPEGAASKNIDTGAAVASKVGGRMGGMFGMARGLMKMGGGLKDFGSAWDQAAAVGPLSRETGAAVMTVRLVVGLRDTDMASRGFGLFRTAGSYDGKPRLVIQADGTEVTLAPPGDGRNLARLQLTHDLVFAEDLMKGRIALANNTGTTVGNTLAKANFAARAIGGGSATISQVHHFDVRTDPAAVEAAIGRNLQSLQQALLGRIGS
ncbi:hypothetical protein GGQ97_000346 [Sphingomonas kaistensis]|uniref:Uncharacterized protein n=1 Tax=Sphingomonas kaistensis TaxID=298708 RepID=A0A7X6BF96_9SPHN|nr:hypothetical protein [Sphingomonas kaistensis]NJC04553.1 hypothetical protein [Sphingomonas kaistensis]